MGASRKADEAVTYLRGGAMRNGEERERWTLNGLIALAEAVKQLADEQQNLAYAVQRIESRLR